MNTQGMSNEEINKIVGGLEKPVYLNMNMLPIDTLTMAKQIGLTNIYIIDIAQFNLISDITIVRVIGELVVNGFYSENVVDYVFRNYPFPDHTINQYNKFLPQLIANIHAHLAATLNTNTGTYYTVLGWSAFHNNKLMMHVIETRM